MDKQTVIDLLKAPAQKDMLSSKILASLTMAQAILESGWLSSKLSTEAKNLFGIKSGKFYQGDTVRMLTTEYYSGQPQQVNAGFRKYPSYLESINDHSNLFLTNRRYDNLVGECNYVTACVNVQGDGYATDPSYSSKLLSLINSNKLYQYDLCIDAAGVIQKGDKGQRVKVLQMLLNRWGYFLDVDGIFGNATLAAVKQFQTSRKITSDGIVGKVTAAQF